MSDLTPIVLADMDAWKDFYAANAEAIEETEAEAFTRACQGGLQIGGGAAPAFLVTFADDTTRTCDIIDRIAAKAVANGARSPSWICGPARPIDAARTELAAHRQQMARSPYRSGAY